MNDLNFVRRCLGPLKCLVIVLFLHWPSKVAWSAEETLPLLQIGTHTYTNVTVTTKAKDYIFMVHSTGMLNVKVAKLPPEIREKLGYTNAPPKVAAGARVSIWARQKFAKLHLPQMERAERSWQQLSAAALHSFAYLPSPVISALGVVVVLGYLFLAYCSMLICRKAGHEPGVLVWLPVLNLFPLLRAAGMSGWWFVAFLVPIFNILAQILWSVKIVQARGKQLWLALLLLLPVTNVFALCHLAFSAGAPPKQEKRIVELMTLDTS